MEPKILFAVKSCLRDAENGANQAIRDTWGKYLNDLYFFIGNGMTMPDEIPLPCADPYEALPQKTRALLGWAVTHGYNFIFICDTDTYIIPGKLLASGFEKYDLLGHIGGHTDNGRYFEWPSGGAGYWLSAPAARLIISMPITNEWAEDRMIGQILGPYIQRGELKAFNHPGYHRIYPDDEWRTDITTHFCARGMGRVYDPEWMQKRYKYNVLGQRVQ